MQRKLYKELWGTRFEKMLKLEEQSVTDYTALLDQTKKQFKGHAITPLLERLISDEKKHAILVRELIELLERQPEQLPKK